MMLPVRPPSVRLPLLAVFALGVLRAGASPQVVAADASTLPPASPWPWTFSGARAVPGADGGLDVALVAGAGGSAGDADLLLSFDGDAPTDDAGRWSVKATGPFERSPADQARFGEGAGVFRAPQTRLTLLPEGSGLFAPGVPGGDFTLEFWLKPTRAESGEIIFLWKASRQAGRTWQAQQVSALILRNRMSFGFIDFFWDPSGKETSLTLQGADVVVPGRWSHHLVRYDSATGLVEYLMDGKPSAMAYATSAGRQGGTVFVPVTGSSGKLELGSNYTGLMDEFRLTPGFVETPALVRYPASGGTALSPVFDLGGTNASLLSIAVDTVLPGEAAVQCWYRVADEWAGWNDRSPSWVPFSPGATLSQAALPGYAPVPGLPPRGRYVQVRLDLYPDAAGERSPLVRSLAFRYEPDPPPPPPPSLSATPGDGAIHLLWTPVGEADVEGYVIYYGYASGDYFGSDAVQGPSPVYVRGAGLSTFSLTGLANGRLYFVAVAAYDSARPPHLGDFSREVTARPSRVSP